ncbi:hypothetical protein YC2023_004977 [Brassica napus]
MASKQKGNLEYNNNAERAVLLMRSSGVHKTIHKGINLKGDDAGALMFADYGICCIHEFDNMDIKNQIWGQRLLFGKLWSGAANNNHYESLYTSNFLAHLITTNVPS